MTGSALGGAPRRRSLVLALVALLLFADGVLVGVLLARRFRGGLRAAPDQVERGWNRPTRTDLRVAAAFAALGRGGLGAALDALEQAAAEDSTVLRGGHQLAHALGRMAVAQNGGDASVIRQCRPDFASGCYHGVVEASVQSRGRVDMAELQRMCLGAGSDERPGAIHECMHGLGHGVLGAEGFDLQAGLRDCGGLTSGYASSCYSGAFMEAVNSAVGESTLGEAGGHAGHAAMGHGGPAGQATGRAPALTIDPKDPYSPCDRFADPYAAECWVFQGFVILRAEGFNAARALEVCERAPHDRVGACYESVGFQLTGLFQRDDAWLVEQCGQAPPGRAPSCGAGVARALVQMDWSGERSVRFCAAAPAAWKQACYAAGAEALTGFASAAQRAALCAGVEQPYADGCRRAAALERGT